MMSCDSRYVIVFNGEVYNYLELRAELSRCGHKFRTSGDTEVLLKGYQVWGEGVLSKCNGMFAFAIWDTEARQLFLARDRFGVKPLYYAVFDGSIAFASEPKSLHVLYPQTAEVSPAEVGEFFVASRSHAGQRTFYRTISAVAPAHYLRFSLDSAQKTIGRYWDYPIPDTNSDRNVGTLDRFPDLFQDSVSLRMRSDVPVGLTLSGGLDSSAVLLASQGGEAFKLRCYTSVYSASERGEERWAQIAAKFAGADLKSVETRTDTWLDLLKKTAHHMDSPGFSPAVLPVWEIMATARLDGVPVLLEGQGSDELFGGYPQYHAVAALAALKEGDIKSSANVIAGMNRIFGVGLTLGWLLRSTLDRPYKRFLQKDRTRLLQPHVYEEWRNRGSDPTLSQVGLQYDPVRKALWEDHSRNVLPSLLHYGDSISMAHGIETRLPFMDYRLVEWVFGSTFPLVRDGRNKANVVDYLAQRKLTQIATRRDKKGYPVPLHDWYNKFGRQCLMDTIANSNDEIWNYFDAKQLQSHMAKTVTNRSLFHLYKVFSIVNWLIVLRDRRLSPLGHEDRNGNLV